MNIGTVIKHLRVRKGLTQSEFAKLCQLSQTALSQIETGSSTPHQSTLEIIAKNLDVPTAVLFLMSIEEKDVPAEKKDSYHMLFPVIQRMIDQIFLPTPPKK